MLSVRQPTSTTGVELLDQPFRPLPVKDTAGLADRLAEAIAQLAAFDITLNPSSRLPAAVRLLRNTSRDNHYPTTVVDIVRLTNAIKLGFNFPAFMRLVQPPGLPGLKEALRRATKGTLDDKGSTGAHRAQSELLLGVTLAAGSLKTMSPMNRPGIAGDSNP